MADKFTLYIKNKGGSDDSAQKAVLLLKTYLSSLISKSSGFSSSEVFLVDDKTSPAMLDTDVVVYVVSRLAKSIISANGGSVALAESNENVLGLTDLNLKICEVYFDRLYDGSPKEFAGACYHEMAHIKANQGNEMHNGKNSFLKASPDYYGSPSDENAEFIAKHLNRKVSMKSGF